jgi:hypothetical protein
MGLFLDDIPTIQRPPVSVLAVLSLAIAVTGFLNIVGFLIGPVLAHIALIRLHGTNVRGRRLAIATLWISYGTLIVAVVALLVILVSAYAALPSPDFF